MKKLVFTSIFFFISFSLIAQDLTLEDQICPSSPVSFTTPDDSSAFLYNWDFCTGDLFQSPNGFVMSSYSGLGPEGIELVLDHKGTEAREEHEWFGFITTSRTNTLIRVNFGASLENANPTLTPINIQFTNCYEMAFTRENGKWYALTVRNNNSPLLIKFDSLTNPIPTVQVIPDPIAGFPDVQNSVLDTKSGFTVKLRRDGDNLIGVFLNNLSANNITIKGVNFSSINDTRMVLVNFGSSITNPISPSNILVSANIGKPLLVTGSNPGFDVIQAGNHWYGLTCGTNNIRHLDFGESLYNIPVVTDITSNISGLNPNLVNTRVRLVRDGSNFVAFIINNSGQFLRLDFGEDMANLSPQFTNLGTLGVLAPNNLPTFSFDIVKEGSSWKAFVINRTLNINILNQIVRLNFPNNCNSNPPTSTQLNPDSIVFLLPEDVEVSLETFSADGLEKAYYHDKIEIVDATVGNFGVTNQCLGETTIFDNFSFGSDDNVANWDWDFGDGNGSGMKNPLHQYSQAGSYEVSLRVFNKSGCENIVTKQINITDIPRPDFIITSIDCENRSVEFEDISTLSSRDTQSGIRIVTREWSFGDDTRFLASTDQETGETRTTIKKGSIGTSGISQAPAYPSSGIYQVSLTVTNSENCVATIAKTISLRDEDRPTADFEYELPCTGKLIQFNDLSTMPSGAIGQIDTWKWKVFDTGGFPIDSSGQQNPTFSFDEAGMYSVRLIAQFSGACPDTAYKEFEVYESILSDFDLSSDIGVAPLRVVFESQTPEAIAYEWHFGDGRVSTEQSPIYVYAEPGIYIAEFQAKNEQGCGTIVSRSITVLEEEQITAEAPLLDQDVKIYPNPTEDVLSIKVKDVHRFKEVTIELYDLYGKKITLPKPQFVVDTYQIRVQHLPQGVYILKLSLGDQHLITRIDKY